MTSDDEEAGWTPADLAGLPNAVQRLRLLRVFAELYRLKREAGLEPLDVLITDMVAIGHLEERPADVSSLAEMLMVPRSTLHRRVHDLIESGWLVELRRGRRLCLYINETAVSKVLPELRHITASIHIKFV